MSFQGPLLERERELAALERFLELSQQGMGKLVTIGAEAGAGKSRLIEEFKTRHLKDTQFLWGQAFAATAHTPYAIWVDAIDNHLQSLSRREALRVLAGGVDIQKLFAGISAKLQLPDEAACEEQVNIAQTRLFAQMTILLSRVAETRPIVLVLDNLQWADRSSIELLHAVIRGTQGGPLLVIALYRPEEGDGNNSLRGCIASLEQLGRIETVQLLPLSPSAASVLCAHIAGNFWPQDILQRLHNFTQGNPLFLTEYAKHLLRRAKRNPSSFEMQQQSVPLSIERLLKERIYELDEDSRRVLTVAAVVEAHADYPLLRSTTGFSDERLLYALDKLVSARLLYEAEGGMDVVYEFHKPLVQATLYGSLGAARKQYLHGVIAEELMRRPARSADASRVAMHLVSSGSAGCQAKALPYLLQAAQHAVSVFGNHEAVALLSLALQIASDGAGATTSLVELHLSLGESQKRLGNFTNAVETWSAALKLASGAQRAKIRRNIARALWQSGCEHDAHRQLEDGVRELTKNAGVEAAWLRQEYALSEVRQGHIAQAMAEITPILEIVDEEVEPELTARIHIVRSMVHGYCGDMRRARQDAAHAIALSEPLAYPGAAFLAYYTMAAFTRYNGDLDYFESLCSNCDRIAAQMHAVALESWPMSLRVERYTFLGQVRRAIEIGERALEIDKSIGQATILPRTHAFLAIAYRLTGNARASRRNATEAQRLVEHYHKTEMRSVVVLETARAYLEFLDQHHRAALERILAIAARLRDREPLRFYLLHPYALPLAAEAAARAEEPALCRKLLSEIEGLQTPSFRPAEGALDYVNGLLALQAKRHDDALSAFRRAISLWTRQQRFYDVARARVALSTAFEDAGKHTEATEQLMLAIASFEQIGAVRDVAMVKQRLRAVGVRPAPARTQSESDQTLSAREQQVASLVAIGKTNKAIARDLFLSELTIETHVKNILRKLGLRSRVQVAAYALRRELITAENAAHGTTHNRLSGGMTVPGKMASHRQPARSGRNGRQHLAR